MQLTAKQQKLLRWIGYPLLAIVVFVFTLAYTFPYERLKGKIIEGLSDKYDVTIASIEPSLIPGTFSIHNMVLVSRPMTADEEPVVVLVDEIEVNIGVFSAIFWTMDMSEIGVEAAAQIGGGVINIEVGHAKGDNTLSVNATVKDVQMDTLPGVASAVGLPVSGAMNAGFELELPRGKWSKAEGEITLNCIACSVGDGSKVKLKARPPANGRKRVRTRQLSPGFTSLEVPKINLGVMEGLIRIEKGVGKIEKFTAKSKDGHLNITGEINFKDPFKESLFPGCLTFGFSDALKEREEKFSNVTISLPPKSRLPNGSYAIPTKGKLVDLRFDRKKQCSDAKDKKGSKAPRKRPTVTANKKPAPRVMPVKAEDKDGAASKDEKEKDEEKTDEDSAVKGKSDSAKDVRRGPTLGRKMPKTDEDDKEPKDDEDGDDDDDDDDDEEEEGDDDDDEEEGDDDDEESDEGKDEPLEDN